MTYQPFLIAKYATGLDRELQPWLIPDEAYVDLFEGFTLHGVTRKRDGYNGLATGERGDIPYCESRMVNEIASIAMTGAIDSANTTYTLTAANTPIRRGSFVVTGTTPAQTATDDGVGGFTGDVSAGTIDYDTGAVSITFNSAPTAGTVTATYSYHPDEPVLGIMNYITSSDVKQLYVANEKRVNLYNTTDNRLEYVGRTLTITGISQANPGEVTTSAAHGMQTGDRIFIYGVVGMTEVNNTEFTITSTGATTFTIGVDTTGYGAYSSGGTVQQIYSGAASNFWDWVNYPSEAGDPRLLFTNNKDQVQVYDPTLTPSFIDYVSTANFAMVDASATTVTDLKCLHMRFYKDRLLLFNTEENGTRFSRRIRISGTGENGDDFTKAATGAGILDIPTSGRITGVDFNRDDIIVFTATGFTQETWILKYTNNDATPFVIDQIDESRGAQAPFSVITYLNRTTGASIRNLIMTDGYRVERMDDRIPDYSYDNIDSENFNLCFAGQVDDEHQHILLHPTPGDDESTRILVHNYEEGSYSVYKIPLSCVGVYQLAFDISWNDLLIYDNWNELAAAYDSWNNFAYSSGAPVTIAGGHHGEVWKLNVIEGEDNPQRIRAITITDAETLTVTTDWNNYKVGDYIHFTAVGGMVELNNKQAQIATVTDNYTFTVKIKTSGFSAYTSSGTATRVIPFELLTKKFNPYVNSAAKVKCGWVYFYVAASDTSVERDYLMTNATQANSCVITTEDAHGLQTGESIRIYGVSGMTELNDLPYIVTVTGPNTFQLDGIDSTAYTAYTSGGFVVVQEKCKLEIDIITNDTDEATQLPPEYTLSPYQGNCTNLITQQGSKKWYKLWINQTARFIQFRVRNAQSGAKIEIHGMMPGFQGTGRLI